MKTVYIVLLNIILILPKVNASTGSRFLLALSDVHDGYLDFWRPCNSKVLGIALKEKDNTLHLAVALQLNYIQCGNMKSRERIKIPFNTNKKLKRLNLGSRPLKARYNKITYLHHNNIKNSTKVIYDKNCQRQGDLLLISKDLKGRPNLSVVSLLNSKTKNLQCQPSSKELIVKNIKWSAKPKRHGSENYLSSDYYSLRLRGANLVSSDKLSYSRNCNEVPLSMVIEKNKKGDASIGVLVASYPNILCYEEKRSVLEHMKFTKMVFTNKGRILAMKTRRLNDSWFIGKIRSSKLTPEIKLSYLKACEKKEFITYNESKGKALIGHLINASSCQTRSRIINSKLPISFHRKNEKLFQFQVKGR